MRMPGTNRTSDMGPTPEGGRTLVAANGGRTAQWKTRALSLAPSSRTQITAAAKLPTPDTPDMRLTPGMRVTVVARRPTYRRKG